MFFIDTIVLSFCNLTAQWVNAEPESISYISICIFDAIVNCFLPGDVLTGLRRSLATQGVEGSTHLAAGKSRTCRPGHLIYIYIFIYIYPIHSGILALPVWVPCLETYLRRAVWRPGHPDRMILVCIYIYIIFTYIGLVEQMGRDLWIWSDKTLFDFGLPEPGFCLRIHLTSPTTLRCLGSTLKTPMCCFGPGFLA